MVSNGVMTTQDRVIADMLNALDAIKREAEGRGSLPFIAGAASQAIANVKAVSVRNKDGYLVVRNPERRDDDYDPFSDFMT